jgi:adenine-specific DNA-methyltransferase
MPPKKPKTSGPIPVDAITHDDTRANLPTADAQDFISPELEQPIPVRYPRDPSLDPQLVWKGKDALDGEDLVADAPPIYIQEKIDPRVLIENLRGTADQSDHEPELTLFDTFDGLPELDLVDFYQHEAKWSNRMILGDSLNVMASLAEREGLRGKVQMIYVDPPYGIKFGSNWQASARKRDVKDGKFGDTTREVEQIRAFRDTWELGIHSYLSYLRDRLVVAHDLLTESGSCFVQIGDENVHLVRSLMDEVFGSENFCSQIAYMTTTGAGSPAVSTDVIAGVNDYILWYSRDREALKYRTLYFERSVASDPNYRHIETGERIRPLTADEQASVEHLREAGAKILRANPLTSQTGGATTMFPFEFEGRDYVPGKGGWKTNIAGMTKVRQAGRLMAGGKTLSFVRYFSDFPYQAFSTIWSDTRQSGFGDPKVYVVQTNAKVIERCMLMTTDPGDLVLDPTCGSGTTAVVAEQRGRRWITIDTSRVALALARQRLMGAKYPYYLLSDSTDGRLKEGELTSTHLPTVEVNHDIRHGFVYERVQHITLKSIANNPDISEGLSRDEVDDAIRRHADYEMLYDKPYEDPRKVRVSGPFTVESLSPHRSLAFAGSAVDGVGATDQECGSATSSDDVTFEQSILANLRTAGIQNGRKGERLTFDTVEPYAAVYIQAVGERDDVTDGTPRRVGITVGPQYGTVGPGFIKDAAREANRAADLDLICVLAFAFDPAVLGTGDEYVTSEEGFANVTAERQLGRVPVLLVRMNADLVMGDELKKTGAGNLFTIFGEPDIAIDEDDGQLRVVLNGVDVYDPNTGELRSSDTNQIALWMIDTEYNEESFFVRHCYFTGGQDPFTRLKRALKADVDEDSWASLYRTESRPFLRPESGKIAVKVINDYGDEVMKVFSV